MTQGNNGSVIGGLGASYHGDYQIIGHFCYFAFVNIRLKHQINQARRLLVLILSHLFLFHLLNDDGVDHLAQTLPVFKRDPDGLRDLPVPKKQSIHHRL